MYKIKGGRIMTKAIKKLLCLTLAILLAFSAITVASAATEDNSSFYTITIENAKTGATQSATAEAAEDVYDTFNALLDKSGRSKRD
jgi:hypothetical protein